tara:strand:- start:253 stop:1140 length:888 start_codon:yes stop_codon:yes gene_type:complete
LERSISTEASKKAGISISEISEYLDITKEASKRGGEILMKHYGKLNTIKTKGREGDLVTNADIESEKIVLGILKNAYPEIGILSEESGREGNLEGLSWCVDPLDGTTNFAHGYPFFATSVGLTWQGLPILGSIDIPFLNETYFAAPGIGAFCNDKRINVSSTKDLAKSLLVTGFAYDRQTRLDNNYAEFCWLTHRTRGVRRGGAAAVDLAFVASGRIDAYWERGLAPWDLAAGSAIVEIAGGLITDYCGNEFDINNGRILASSPGIQSAMILELGKVKPLQGDMFGAPEITNFGP